MKHVVIVLIAILALAGCTLDLDPGPQPEILDYDRVADEVIAEADAVDDELTAPADPDDPENGEPSEIRAGTADVRDLAEVMELPPPPSDVCPRVKRVSGSDRFATAAQLAKTGGFPSGGKVVVARGDSSPDALVAGPLARALGGPLLLTLKDELPDATETALRDLAPSEVVIIGGTGAISAGVASEIDRIAGRVRRIAGATRYDTSALVAEEVGAGDLFFVASGDEARLVDAVAAAGPAAALGAPILYVADDSVPSAVAAVLRSAKKTIVVGGTTAVSDAVMRQLPNPQRAGGETRYETALAVIDAARAEGFRSSDFLVARGDQTADALAASPLGRPTVLSETDVLPRNVADYLLARRARSITLLGGKGALSSTVAARACSVFSQAATLDGDPNDHAVYAAGISNHGDDRVKGSLAWFLARADEGDIVSLFGGDRFEVGATISVPVGVQLRGVADQTLIATNALDGGLMIALSDRSGIRNVVVDGNHRARELVRGNERTDIVVASSTLRRTKNQWPSGENPRCHGIQAQKSLRAVIAGNLVEKIGYPKVDGRAWAGVCAGIYVGNSESPYIDANRVFQTLTAGIDFTASMNATVRGNTIEQSGRNVEFEQPTADGITAYHNGHTGPANTLVEGNTIIDSGHNGIHTSGAGVVIRDNRVEGVVQEGILHQDHKSPTDCAYDVLIENNVVRGAPTGGRAVWIGNNYRVGGVRVVNSGQVYEEPGAICP